MALRRRRPEPPLRALGSPDRSTPIVSGIDDAAAADMHQCRLPGFVVSPSGGERAVRDRRSAVTQPDLDGDQVGFESRSGPDPRNQFLAWFPVGRQDPRTGRGDRDRESETTTTGDQSIECRDRSATPGQEPLSIIDGDHIGSVAGSPPGAVGAVTTVDRGDESLDLVVGKPGRAELGEASNVADSHPQRCLLYTSPSPRDLSTSRMPSSA